MIQHRIAVKVTWAGLGDQMMQMDLIHRIAAFSQGRYVHLPMFPKRIFPDVGDFTGIDLYHRLHPDPDAPPDLPQLMIDLVDLFDEDCTTLLPEEVRSGAVLAVVKFQYLNALPKMQNLYRRIAQSAPFPFRDLYRLGLQGRPSLNPATGRIRLVVHLRLGDTATMTLADGRRLTADGMRILGTDPTLSVRPPVDVARAIDFCRHMAADPAVDVMLLSDGYDLAIRNLKTFRSMVPGLSIEERDSLIAQLEEKGRIFETLPAEMRRVGETEEDTRFAIDTLAAADLVVRTSGGFALMVARHMGGVPPNRIFDLDAALATPDLVRREIARIAEAAPERTGA